MKKYVSQGMILSAEHDGQLTLLTVDPAVPNGKCDWVKVKDQTLSTLVSDLRQSL